MKILQKIIVGAALALEACSSGQNVEDYAPQREQLEIYSSPVVSEKHGWMKFKGRDSRFNGLDNVFINRDILYARGFSSPYRVLKNKPMESN